MREVPGEGNVIERRIAAMHKRFGTKTGQYCKGCTHLISFKYHDRTYHKCELYGLSHSESSDWRRSWMACGMHDQPVNDETWVPVMKLIKHTKPPEPPIEGQIRLEV